jgi:hypothetical protein
MIAMGCTCWFASMLDAFFLPVKGTDGSPPEKILILAVTPRYD